MRGSMAGQDNGTAQRHRAVAPDRRRDPHRYRQRAVRRGRQTDRRSTSWPARFGVNRHTVREAIASLVHEGVLRSEQGRGTFVQQRRRFAYPIGPRTRFSTGLDGQAHELRGLLVGHAYEQASEQVAAGLEIKPGARVLRLETLSEADGQSCRARPAISTARASTASNGFSRDALDHRIVQGVRRRRLSPALDAGLGAPCRCRRPRRPQAVAGLDRAGHRRRQ